MQNLITLHVYRDLLLSWTWRTVRSRYKQSILGGAWAVIQPVATVVIFSIIFTLFIPVDTGDVPYFIFSYTAMVPWILFSTSITDMVDSIVSNMNLVGKIYFPREILPISALLARLLDFTIAYALLVFVLLFYRVEIYFPSLLLLPFVLCVQLALSLGLGLFGGALNVFYRDIKHIFTLLLQLWFYATPIIYPVTVVPNELLPFYFLNPMAGVIEAYRAILLNQELPGVYLLISAGAALITLIFGYWFFKRAEVQFADVI